MLKLTILILLSVSVLSTPLFGNFKFKDAGLEDANSKFGGYVIPTANLSQSCQKYDLDEILYDDATIETKHKELTGMFENGRDSMEKWIKNGNDSDGKDAVMAASVYAIPSIIFLSLSLICTPLFCLYFFCKTCCCNSKVKRNQVARGWDSR